MNRSKLAALLGAGLLTMGIAGTALADSSLLAGQVGKALSTFTTGSTEECADQFPDLAAGEVGLHFVLTSPAGDTGDITGHVDGTAFGPTAVGKSNNGTDHWYVTVDGTSASILNDASVTVDGNNLVLSHVCYGAAAPTETPGGGGGDQATQPSTDAAIGQSGSSGPSDTAWLLVVGLGVLLASVVVLTPARSKTRR